MAGFGSPYQRRGRICPPAGSGGLSADGRFRRTTCAPAADVWEYSPWFLSCSLLASALFVAGTLISVVLAPPLPGALPRYVWPPVALFFFAAAAVNSHLASRWERDGQDSRGAAPAGSCFPAAGTTAATKEHRRRRMVSSYGPRCSAVRPVRSGSVPGCPAAARIGRRRFDRHAPSQNPAMRTSRFGCRRPSGDGN